jgi:hypothetical protein
VIHYAPADMSHRMPAKVGTMIRELLGLRFSGKLIVLFAIVSLSSGILRLDIRSTPITGIFYLMALLASFVLAGMLIYRLVHTKIVEHFLLSIAIGATPLPAVPGCRDRLVYGDGCRLEPAWQARVYLRYSQGSRSH